MGVLIGYWDIDTLKRPSSNAPAVKPWGGTNFPWVGYAFNKDNIKIIYGHGIIPESPSYNEGGDVKGRFYWVTDAATVGTARWRVEVRGVGHSEDWDGVFSDSEDVDSVRIAGDKLHVAEVTISAPSLSPGDKLIVKVSRVANHGNDDYDDDAWLVGFGLAAI